ncbi:MAG: hypothetical protein PHS33_07570 [Candidatus Omnitrophica bacterium]|nr:hypothetical protein [Candidatus Omnitrophota bacterium]
MKKIEMQKQIDSLLEERKNFISMFGQIRDAIGGTIGMNVDHVGIAPEAVVRNILEKKNLISASPDLLETLKTVDTIMNGYTGADMENRLRAYYPTVLAAIAKAT